MSYRRPYMLTKPMSQSESAIVAKPPHSSPESEGGSDGFIAILSNVVVVSGLDEKKQPDTCIEVLISRAPSQKSEAQKAKVIKNSAHPRWLEGDNKLTVMNLRPSSTMKLRLLRRGFLHGRVMPPGLMGEYEARVVDIVSEDTAGHEFLLKQLNIDDPLIKMSICVTITRATPTTIADFGIDDASSRLANAYRALARRQLGENASSAFRVADDIVSAGADAQVFVDGAKALSGEQIIGGLVSALDAVVKIGDEVSATHPMIKIAWIAITCVYKAAKAQQQVDEDSRQLAEGLSSLLAYAAASRDLPPVNGREGIVDRVVALTKEGACLIDESMAYSFFGRAALGPLSDVKGHIKICRSKAQTLKEEFNTAVAVDTRERVKALEADAILSTLSSAKGADWNEGLACMEGTRKDLRQKVSSWIRAERETAGIFLLTAPAGAGKSALAHAVACDAKASSEDVLVVSFFFDRSVADRSHPQLFVSTLVRALAERDAGGQFRTSVIASLRDDRDIQSKRLEEQFSNLLVRHSRAITNHRVLIVIDALDECSLQHAGRKDLSSILNQTHSVLPSSFRVFLTSRPDDPLVSRIGSNRPYVVCDTIDITKNENHSDVATYIDYRLQNITTDYDLKDESWPGEKRRDLLVVKSGGLFIWAALGMDYVAGKNGLVDGRLDAVIAQRTAYAASIEQNLNTLYTLVLSAIDLANMDHYHSVVGVIIAAKTPLSKASLKSLVDVKPDVVDGILHTLSPLFTGVDTDNTPVQTLHLTLHEFLTDPLRSKDYFIDEAEHSRSLGCRCLKLLTNSLSQEIPGLGWSSFWDRYQYRPIPSIRVPEAVAYSCHFWIDHITDSADESWDKYLNLLEAFSPCLISWLEVATALGEFPALDRLRSWATASSFGHTLASIEVASSLGKFSNRLSDVGRREDALKAIVPAVNIYRQLAKDRPEAFNPDLAASLNNLSSMISGVGHREDALKAIEEAVNIHRQLAKDRPEAFNPDLAMSLNNLSYRLNGVGRQQDALKAIEEAVNIYRQLAKDRPEAFNSDLAMSLNNLSSRLSDVGRREEALKASEEAVNIYRQLAKDHPEAFNPDLAMSLNNLSNRLNGVGRREEALKAIVEAVNIYRQLAKDRPEAFNPDLAMSLNNLSNSLGDLGRREEALKASEEAVNICRQLAEDRPEAFNPDLAQYLNNLSARLHDVGRREDALKAIEEAVNIHRQLARDRPEAFNHALAMSLFNSSIYFSVLRLKEDALRTANESLGLYRLLHSERPIMFQQDLIDALNQVADCLSALDQDEEASQYRGEAEALKAELAPTTVQPDA